MRAKIRIDSDGTRTGTNIYAVAPNGDETALAGITGVDWTIDVKTGVATATLRVHRARLDALLDAGHVVAILEPAPPRPPWWKRLWRSLPGGIDYHANPRPQPPRAGAPTTDFVPDPPCAADRRLRATAGPLSPTCPRCAGTDPWDRRPVNIPDEGIVPCPHLWHERAASIALTWKPWFDIDKLELALLAVLEDADHDGGFSATGYNPAAGLTPEEWQAKRLTETVLSFLFDVDSRRVTQRR